MKKTLGFAIVFSTSFLISEVSAMGAQRPKAPTAPVSNPSSPSSIIPTLDFGAELSLEDYLDSSSEIGPQVDDFYNDNELVGVSREKINGTTDISKDSCFKDEDSHEYFANQISYYTAEMMDDVPSMVGFIGSSYGTSTNDNNYFPTSLIRHPLCNVNSASLSATIKKVPGQATIDKLNRYANKVNSLRKAVLEADQSAKKELLSTWSGFFSCLAYTESLGTADSASSQSVAKKMAPAGYRKPAGVKFYDDPAQSAESRLNIGLFQFTPTASGNIQPCLRAWNKLHQTKSQCQINQKASQNELIQILGSSLQSFNAFCGVHKLVQTFSIQVNTNKASATAPQNLVNGKLKPYEQRCVTPHFQAGKAYNHFGPFQNSTGSNLDKLFSCVDRMN